MKRILVVICAVLAVAAAGLVGFVYSGWYDVGADVSESGFMRWLLHTTMERSVARRAAQVGPPPDLDDPALVRIGAEHYKEMCVQCHLAPGVESTEMRQGLNPKPPRLERAAPHMSDQALFWVIKHGVRMSAMPAWGKTHPDNKIWALVAFLRRLPRITEQQFRTLASGQRGSPSPSERGTEHEHE
jgi:mono/diheme cytochrome c family protein